MFRVQGLGVQGLGLGLWIDQEKVLGGSVTYVRQQRTHELSSGWPSLVAFLAEPTSLCYILERIGPDRIGLVEQKHCNPGSTKSREPKMVPFKS